MTRNVSCVAAVMLPPPPPTSQPHQLVEVFTFDYSDWPFKKWACQERFHDGIMTR